MKKILYLFALVLCFTGCKDDEYEPWADPQSNPQEDAQTVAFGNGAVTEVATIKLADVTSDNVQVCTITAPTVSDPNATFTKYELIANNTVYEVIGNGQISTAELTALVEGLYGKNPVERTVPAVVKAYYYANGQSLVTTSNEFNIKAIPDAPFIDPNGYYVVGNIDGWTCTRVEDYHMTNGGGDVYADPVFSVELKAVDDITTYGIKIIPASAFKEDGSVGNWDIALSGRPGETASAYEGMFSYANEGDNFYFDAVDGAKYYKVTINLLEGTYTITALNDPEVYMTGNELGWGATWLKLYRANPNWGGPEDIWWFIRYFQANEEFKFSPEAAWNGDFGGNQMTVTDNAGAGYSDAGTNCKVANAGWYQITINTTNRTLVIDNPKVYLCGEIVANGWNASIPDEANRFTNPTTADGEFVSPAFVNNGNVRMFTLVEGVDWWRTEYNVFGENIVIRTEGDQDGVYGTAGQKAYLNFTTLKGSIK